jgi:6-phosphogluconolactonase
VPERTPAGSKQLIVGTYTEKLPHVDGRAPGILACSYEGGVLGPPRILVPARNPSWITITSSGATIYAVNETTNFKGNAGGGVTAYARDVNTGALTELNSRSSAGVEPAHIELDNSERFVLVANYRSGSITVYPLNEDGGLGEMLHNVQHVGSSTHPVRQAGPHAHMILPDPVTGRILVTDLGLDSVLIYDLEESGKLSEITSARISTKPGAGPRHLVFHPDKRYLFLLNELDNTLVALVRNGGSFDVTDIKSTLPDAFSGHNQSAAVRVSLSGQYVYTSNRGHNSIAIFRFEESTGELSLVRLVAVGGDEPRDFCLSPDGKYLLVANQNTHAIVSFAIDESGPDLSQVSVTEVPSPVCLVFTH